MGGRYGMSFAKKYTEEGKYEDAVRAATEDIDSGGATAETFVDRAAAYELLERFAEAVDDLERAIEVNTTEQELDPFVIDDAYFSALLSAAKDEQSKAPAKATSRMDRYIEAMPEGAHVAEAREWKLRLKGELPSLLDKRGDYA